MLLPKTSMFFVSEDIPKTLRTAQVSMAGVRGRPVHWGSSLQLIILTSIA